MDVKAAVSLAKGHIKDVFADESISNLGLEEVYFDDSNGIWNVTIGFSRPWNTPKNVFSSAFDVPQLKRSYKILRISDNGEKILSIKNREPSLDREPVSE